MCHQSSHHCPCSCPHWTSYKGSHWPGWTLSPWPVNTSPISAVYRVWHVTGSSCPGYQLTTRSDGAPWYPCSLAAIITPRHHATIFSQFDIQITPCAPSLAGMEIGRSAGWTLCSPRYSDCAPGQAHCCDHSQSWLPRPVIWHHQDLILHQAGAGQF